MNPLSRWMCRCAVVYLVAGTGVGGLLLVDKALGTGADLWWLRPLHIEWLAVGWMAQLAMGVAFWTFPRRGAPPRQAWMRLAFVLLNAGLLSVSASVFAALPGLAVGGHLLEVVAVGAFGYAVGPRVRRMGGYRSGRKE